MAKICDNKSAGEILRKDGKIVLIDRHNYPESYALPAGHLDGDTFARGVERESQEEVGITIGKNKSVWSGRIDNPCKREGGSFHDWEVFEASVWSGDLRAGDDAKRFFRAAPDELKKIAARTEYFMKKYGVSYENIGELTRKIFGDPTTKNTDPEWKADMGLEPVWYFILKKLHLI